MVFSRENPHSFSDALRVCRDVLARNRELIRKGSIEAETELLVIGAHARATGERLTRTELFTRLKDGFPEGSGEQLLILAGQRAEGIPLQHVLGCQTFLGHEYAVNSSTLIPRPETEVLVTEAVRELRAGHPVSGSFSGIEIGLGSGVIATELLCAFPGLRMTASETSPAAAELARANARKILGDLTRLTVIPVAEPCQVLEAFGETKADFLISNPPYLDPSSAQETEEEVRRHEPSSALFASNGDALHFYRKIAQAADQVLLPGGRIFLEIASERAEETRALFADRWDIKIVPDLSGRPRVLIASLKGNGKKERG